MIHPARTLPFRELKEGLAEAVAAGNVNEHVGNNGLRLYCYSRDCVYEKRWDNFSLMSRGLVIDHERVVATPFPKFFNVGERIDSIPDRPFETFEKVDGSLIIIFWHDGEWRTATKGSLSSDQAMWAVSRLSNTEHLKKGTTYLCEAIYPENRIVVRYHKTGLVLLGAYDEGGHELSYNDLLDVAYRVGWMIAQRHSYSAVSELIAKAGVLPASEEGFVVRFDDGLRLKIKGDEYCRIHALISRLTPLAMWDSMRAGDDLEAVRRDLPEEFWGDFDAITSVLRGNVQEIVRKASVAAANVKHLSDKDVGLQLDSFPSDVRQFIFPCRKNGDLLQGRARDMVYRSIRPTGNVLPGYTPSYAINRVTEEAQ